MVMPNPRNRAAKCGTYRERVTIQSYTESDTGNTGEPTKSWSNVKTVWAAVRPLSGAEPIVAEKVQGEATHEVEMRHTTFNREDRIVWGSQTLYPVGPPIDPEARGIKLIVICKEDVG